MWPKSRHASLTPSAAFQTEPNAAVVLDPSASPCDKIVLLFSASSDGLEKYLHSDGYLDLEQDERNAVEASALIKRHITSTGDLTSHRVVDDDVLADLKQALDLGLPNFTEDRKSVGKVRY